MHMIHSYQVNVFTKFFSNNYKYKTHDVSIFKKVTITYDGRYMQIISVTLSAWNTERVIYCWNILSDIKFSYNISVYTTLLTKDD